MDSDRSVSLKIMATLREWGWDVGLDRIKAQIVAEESDERRAMLRYLVGWLAGERGRHEEALEVFKQLEGVEALRGRALAGQAFIALRQARFAEVHELLERARASGDERDSLLQAVTAHCRGTAFHHEGRTDEALDEVGRAVSLYGDAHLGAGRALDTLGMIHAGENRFHAALAFFERALEVKAKFADEAGIAVTNGQLGRLHLDWGILDRSEEYLRQDLDLCRRIGDERGEAQMYDHLGQVALARGDAARAAEWLDESVRRCARGGWTRLEAYARKDRALAHVMRGDLVEAEAQLGLAAGLFDSLDLAEGRAHVNRALGVLRRHQGRFAESERALRDARMHFETRRELAEVARTQLEGARTLQAAGAARPLVTEELLRALHLAERSRRDALVREIEDDLRRTDEAELCRHIHRRTRGRRVREDTVSLLSGDRETASVLFFDLQGSTEFARVRDPEVVMMTLNELMASLGEALERYGVSVTAYLGDGFMGLVRGAAWRPRSNSCGRSTGSTGRA